MLGHEPFSELTKCAIPPGPELAATHGRDMIRSTCHPWLDRFAWLTAGATFLLLGLGGLVTSHEAGMAVPDWPTTYGYNMFLFPLHLWQGNIFYEHTHRLLASFVGLLTTILAVWLWLREPRSWLRWLGAGAFFAILLQGLLGGLRVILLKDEIGIFHATLAQLFFVLLCAIALLTTRWWRFSLFDSLNSSNRRSVGANSRRPGASRLHAETVETVDSPPVRSATS